MHAHRDSNQSGAEKDNRPVFREQYDAVYFFLQIHQESNYEFKMAEPTKVGDVGKQPTSLDRGLG